MLIESLIRRKGGTFIPFGPASKPDIVYHFKPLKEGADGPHVCNVVNEDHVARFLSITEGFCEADPNAAVPPPKAVDYSKMKPEELVNAFRMKFGRDPSSLMKIDTLIKKLEE